MKGFDLIITLEDDCVFSERNATEGGHSALDYIPGGALLGAAAARLYKDNDAVTAFDWFHSGKVRFSNAYQLTQQGHRTYPIPACWHEAKNEPATEDAQGTENNVTRLNTDKVWRLDKMPKMQLPSNKQPKQIRDGYIAQNGHLAEPKKHLRMKTAIDAATGRAKEGVLFGYDSLRAGQCFYAQIQLDDDLNQEAVESIKAVFKQPLLLGRSRSAEYGRASAKLLDRADSFSAVQSDGNEITLWLQSDLMVLDAYGQPTLCPSSTDLGLPDGKFLAEKSFIRTRRYSTWNAYKHGYEMERQVICKGGVLVYELKESLETKHFERLAHGLGLERQAGLGQVWLNPAMLDNEKPSFNLGSEPVAVEMSANKQVMDTSNTPKKTLLIKWLELRDKGVGEKQNQAKIARSEAQKYLDFLASSRKLKGLDKRVFVGPSLSQWGDLLSRLKSDDANSVTSIIDSKDGSFKSNGEGWSDEFQKGDRIISFYAWFNGVMKDKAEPYYVMQLIREIMDKLKSAKGGQA